MVGANVESEKTSYKLRVMACSYCISVRVLWVVKVYGG